MRTPILIPQNPLHPLPEDYFELTGDGQRLARVNACRQWLVPDLTPEQLGHAFVGALRFFDLYYLYPDHKSDFDPMFYDDDPLETPPFHEDILKLWASKPRSITIAPRGSAKSFLVRKASLLRLMTRPMYSIIYATSTGDNAKGAGQALKDQFHNNSRLNDDWTPEQEFGGRLVPRRGEATFGVLHMQLRNGSWFRSISSESKMRGGRPRRFVLDDPEFDSKASTSMQLIREYMETLLFKVVLPMVFRAGCGVDWLATYVSRRHYAWHATQVESDTDGTLRAKDPRFGSWVRMVIRAAYEDAKTKEIQSCWPDMWPPSRTAKALNPRWKDRVSLEEIEEAIGTANFNSEYMANPGAGEGCFFPELTEKKHGFQFKHVDDLLLTKPYKSKASIRWYDCGQETWKDMPLVEFLKGCRLFITVDTSYTATVDSDSKVACLMGLNWSNDLFVLDLWSKKCHEPILIDETMRMADRWRCPSIHVEAIKTGFSVYHALVNLVATRGTDLVGGISHLPAIRKINPGPIRKEAKISVLSQRFEYGKIKLPFVKRQRPMWKNLFGQIEQFNPDAHDGGLQHDDEIDCVGMSQFVLKGRGIRPNTTSPESMAPVERLKRGEQQNDELGIHIGLQVDWSKVSAEDMGVILAQQQETNVRGRPSRV